MSAIQPTTTDSPQPPTSNPTLQLINRQPWLNSIGSRLFFSVIAGATLGLGITATLFYQILEQRSTSEIRGLLDKQVSQVETQLGEARYFIKGMANTIEFARNEQKVSGKEPYKQLVFKSFLKRPNLAMAAYFLQAPNGIVTDTKWFAPYYYIDQKAPGQQGQKLAAPYSNVIYSDLWTDDDYPNKDYYKTEIASSQESLLLEPYIWYGTTMTSFMTKVRDSQNKIIGLAGVDINVNQIGQNLQTTVLEDAGYFSLLSEQGKLLSHPPDPKKAKAIESYQTIPALKQNWKQLTSQKAGFIREGGNYWFYQRVPSNNWLMLAVVPESAVLGPMRRIILLGSLAAAGILAAIVALFVRSLNRSLKPILDECNKLAQADAATQELLNSQDEVGRLSTSFFNLLEQVKENENTIRQEAAMRLALEEEQRRVKETESAILQGDIAELLDVVSAVEEGNLGVQAPVSDRVTGLVSDTLNRLIEELAAVMSQVSSAARNVSSNSQVMKDIAGTVADNADRQAESVSEVLGLSSQVEQSARATVEELQHSNRILLSLTERVKEGQSAINSLTQGTTTLQQGTEQIIQQMKTLGEFIGLTEQLVQDQNQIAAQTQILALNASLVAARSAEQKDPAKFAAAAQEFEAIANQVSQLAQQTNQDLANLEQRTAQIQKVLVSVDTEVQGLGSLVSGFAESVERSNLAFNSVQAVTTSVVQTSQQVADSSQDIIDNARSTADAVKAIVQLAQKTADLTLNARQQSESMGQLSTQLLQRVEFFRLPDELTSESPVEAPKLPASNTR
jgi:methyl-accepting chemotaxis protein PixJ